MINGRMTDRELLAALDLRADGMGPAAIARRLRLSRGTVSGALYRIDRETERSPHDGTMPPGWWRAGLVARGERP